MTSTREIGDEFEEEIIRLLNEHSPENEWDSTAGSGSKWQDGDIRHQDYVGECKVKSNVRGFTAPASELNKLISEADKQFKDWLYFERNGDGRTMVLMDMNTFLELYEKATHE